jgi:hypothetical protein
MFDNRAPQGGYQALLEEALVSNSSAASVFANAPVATASRGGTVGITLTIYSGTLTLTWLGATPVAGSVGNDLGVGTHDITISAELAKKVKAIGGASGYVTYWGVA